MKCPKCDTVLAEFNPQPGVRILVTMPNDAPVEAMRAAAQSMREQFPEHPILIKPESMTVEEAEERAAEPSEDRAHGKRPPRES